MRDAVTSRNRSKVDVGGELRKPAAVAGQRMRGWLRWQCTDYSYHAFVRETICIPAPREMAMVGVPDEMRAGERRAKRRDDVRDM